MKIRFVPTIAALLIAAPALAYDYVDRADVIDAVPVYDSVPAQQRECWTESMTTYDTPARSGAGSFVGAIAGGLLGAQVGQGNGRIAAAAAGAAIGALVGDRMDNGYRDGWPVERPVERCRTTASYRDELTGYRVTYLYNGRQATVMLPYDPGPTLLIGVEVAGAQRGAATWVLPPSREYRPIEVTQIVVIDDDWKHGRHGHPGKHKGKPHWY